MKQIILIQHCQSEHHLDRSVGPDSQLTELGRKQALCVASRLKLELGSTPCQLYTSALKRATQTAEVIAEMMGLPVTTVDELRESGSPAPQTSLPESNDSPKDDRVRFLFDTRPSANIESWREFHARVCTFMDSLANSVDFGHLPIIVTHGGTLSNIVVWWLRLPLDSLPERTPFAASPASISVLRMNQYDNPVIGRLNDRSHLYQAGLAQGIDLCP